MRCPAYMSPTSLKVFESNREEYYIRYLAEARPPKLPQTQPMSIGSAFDAYIKSYLHYALFGNYGMFEKETIFEKQVEPHNRDWARVAGGYAFDVYKQCGALADMMLELGTAVNAPRFEFDLLGEIDTNIGPVPIMGKPDVYFINGEGGRVILDWKVNGYCSRSATSPMKGYVMCRDGWRSLSKKPSAGNRMPHKDCIPTLFKGLKINSQEYMEDLNAEWAAQLTMYAWLLGEEIGSQDLIVGVDQIVGQPSGNSEECLCSLVPGELIKRKFEHRVPWLRIASHRVRIGATYQFDLRGRLESAWNAITSGHIFTGRDRADSDVLCAVLEEQAAMFADSNDPMSEFINSTRTQ